MVVSPTHRWVKINIDGALNVQDKLSGVGVVIRDWRGGHLVARGTTIPRRYIGTNFGAVFSEMAQQQGFQQVVVESDCLKAIATLNWTHSDLSAIGTIADDVLQLASTFPMVRFIHVSRLCNGVAHLLAKFALSSSNNLVWFEEPPILVQELLFQDMCNSFLFKSFYSKTCVTLYEFD
ncbi:hypothetical protein DVH24_031602 [Malus domestica]|uniref:RNase H type-1 domain-containing protein n=1 Tax=Malus domestica TaxID=3750 RepID=A0A498J3L0_MALDO|nr:hypothetical protein DVH24_031602 [Malus domestica]